MDKTSSGLINGLLGVIIFAGSLPATRAAVASFDPFFLTVARAAIAGVLGAGLLIITGERRPAKADLMPLIIVAFGVVRGGETPHPAFWLFACLGSALVACFALSQDLTASPIGDGLMLAAVVVCGLGYAEGAKLSRRLGGWQVISWALVLSLPLVLLLTVMTMPVSFADVSRSAWLGLIYVSLFSMLIGFVFWYRGLAQGGIAAIGQLQLLQPFIGLALAATLLGETVSATMLAVTLGIILCVIGARRFAR